MWCSYDDIRSRIQEEPKWWDENAVPRYVEFAPKHAANIYAREVALCRIRCQQCHREFLVAMSCDEFDRMYRQNSITQAIAMGILHYGDAPNVGCCSAGATMNSEMLEVVQLWQRLPCEDWKRIDEPKKVTVSEWLRAIGIPEPMPEETERNRIWNEFCFDCERDNQL